MDAAPAVELRVLGPLELVADGASLPLTAEKHRLLLATLAIRAGELLPAEVLVDALWAGQRPASDRKLLHIYVSQLRALLPATIRIETHGSAYVLELGVASVDAQRFERMCAEGRKALDDGNPALARSLFVKALALWRGPAYGELAYAEVVRTQADRLEELRVVALGARLEAELALGGTEDLVGQARSLVAEHPHDERLAGLAMLALYRAGRQAEALDEYNDARSRLLDELGLEPGPELRELQRAILVHDPSLQPRGAAPEPSVLPAAPGALVGRTRELAEVLAILAHDDVRFVVLTGAGGSGKTRLALDVARTAAPSFANGAALVSLAPVRDSSLLVSTILAALGVRERPEETSFDALVSALRSRELLLLVDNVEHLRDACSVLVDLLAIAPRLKILATSRTVLHLSGEHVYPVEPLGPADAAELFRRRVREAEPRLSLEGDADLVDAICARLEGLPLAIELAAGRARTLRPAELLERLDERLPLLTGGPRDLPARQQTLRATLEWSLELLDYEERTALERLAVFFGGCTAEAAEKVCAAPLDRLAALVDHSLLRRLMTENESRYSMLETVRELAWQQLGHKRAALERRHAEWAVELAESATLRGPSQSQSVARLRAEEDNLRAALAWTGAAEPQLQLRLAAALWRFWWVRGELAEGRRWLGAALEHEVDDPGGARAHALVGIAGLSWSQGDLAAARTHALEAVVAARVAGEPFLEASAHTVLGLVAKHERRFADAREHLRSSMDVAAEAALEVDLYVAKLNLATIELDAGELATAEQLLEEVLAWHEGNGPNVEGMGFALLNLGLVSHGLGDQSRAKDRFARALEAFEHVDFREHVADALHGLAAVEASSGRHEEAARLFGRAEPMLRDVGSAGFEPALVARTRTKLEQVLGPARFGALLASGRES